MKTLSGSLLFGCLLSCAGAAPAPQPVQRCEPDAYVYQWRDASGRMQMGDCAPEDAEGVRAIARASLKPTLIQPPPRPEPTATHTSRKRRSRSSTRPRGPDSEALRGLSAKCRWLVGRIEHLKGLVKQHRRYSSTPSLWQPELDQWRIELGKARCDVRI